ncbi:MAG: L-aspartate oxidase [Bacteroidota bacterium]
MQQQTQQRQIDTLVIGSGVAGLFFALKAAEHGEVLMITKAQRENSNTRWAQGGIAGVVSDEDSLEAHVQDTLIAGDGLCKEDIVRMVVSEGPERIRELMAWGAEFDRAEDGELLLAKEGGHSAHRILHHADATGAEIVRALVKAVADHPRIEVVEHLFAIDLLTEHHLGMYVNKGTPLIHCFGVYALDVNTGEVLTLLARNTVLATGGAGNVYASTTNPPVATGDGIAMGYRAMARVANMEFVQFHPTAFFDPETKPAFLITEAMRGAGAKLLNSFSQQPFMQKYDERLELAPRDVVARAIDAEMKQSGTNYVLLDARHLPDHVLREEFPNIDNYLKDKGLDMRTDLIPVRPAAHYTCGGLLVDEMSRTSLVNLYAIGEVSCTGLHGANRLASNSLLEAIVFAERAARDIAVKATPGFQQGVPDWDARNTQNTDEWVLVSHNRSELQNLMSDYVGIVRSDLRLQRAGRRIELLYEETEDFYRRTSISPEACELRNLITCAYLTVKSAAIRKESRGLHATTDFPDKLERAFDSIL